MVLIICILMSAGFAYYAIKQGFYETWALTFNIVVSVYVAVFLSPTVFEILGETGESKYAVGLVLVGIAILTFAVLHGFSYVFLTGQFRITLPKIVDWIGSGVAGVVAGIVVWSFLGFFILTLPFSSGRIDKDTGMIHDLDVYAKPSLANVCGVVEKIISYEGKYSANEILDGLAVSRDDGNQKENAETGEEEIEEYESVYDSNGDINKTQSSVEKTSEK